MLHLEVAVNGKKMSFIRLICGQTTRIMIVTCRVPTYTSQGSKKMTFYLPKNLTCNALHGHLLRVTPLKSLHFTTLRYALHEEMVVIVQYAQEFRFKVWWQTSLSPAPDSDSEVIICCVQDLRPCVLSLPGQRGRSDA